MSTPQDPAARAQRKADLLAASSLLRLHAAGAAGELAELTDALARRVSQVRALAASPWVRMAGVALGVALLARRRRRGGRVSSPAPAVREQAPRLWPWLALAWRVGGPVVVRWLAGGPLPRR